ncbi:hypothetical protein SeMB42_g04055 [Synchytrium endobioticum]|uniref:Uncharacterized protein n=1 Tax=Synchytrium endobioticum TaxID=286115 RepID=A0A507D1J5_9FUNG|nr:hypothetical protein SeMB42_g04055 [Synchytrium endobioticum]
MASRGIRIHDGRKPTLGCIRHGLHDCQHRHALENPNRENDMPHVSNSCCSPVNATEILYSVLPTSSSSLLSPPRHCQKVPIMSSAIAPLVGRFRRRVVRDVVGSVALGTVLAIGYWNFVHIPQFNEYDTYFKKVQAEIKEKEDSWRAALNQLPASPAPAAGSGSLGGTAERSSSREGVEEGGADE